MEKKIINKKEMLLTLEHPALNANTFESDIYVISGRKCIAEIHSICGTFIGFKKDAPDLYAKISDKSHNSSGNESTFNIRKGDVVLYIEKCAVDSGFAESPDLQAFFEAIPDIFNVCGYTFDKIVYACFQLGNSKNWNDAVDNYIHHALTANNRTMLILED